MQTMDAYILRGVVLREALVDVAGTRVGMQKDFDDGTHQSKLALVNPCMMSPSGQM